MYSRKLDSVAVFQSVAEVLLNSVLSNYGIALAKGYAWSLSYCSAHAPWLYAKSRSLVPELFDRADVSFEHAFIPQNHTHRHSVRPCMLVDQVDRLHCRPWYYLLLLKRMVVLGLGNV